MSQTVADRVKAKRLDMGLLQPDFAHLVGIPERTYQDYEQGKRPIPSDRLVQIARRLKCDLNTFDPDFIPNVEPEPTSENSKPMPPIEWVDKIAESVVSRLAAKSAPDRAVSVDEVLAQIEAARFPTGQVIKDEKRPYLQLGHNIRELRKKAGYRSADEFAHASGVSISSLRDIERGVKEGHFSTREAIANALNCTVADLYKAHEEPKGNENFSIETAVLKRLADILTPKTFSDALEICDRILRNMDFPDGRRALSLFLLSGNKRYLAEYVEWKEDHTLESESLDLSQLLKAVQKVE